MTREEFSKLMLPIMQQSEPEVFIKHMTGFLFSFIAADITNDKDYNNEDMARVEVGTKYGSINFIIDLKKLKELEK